MGRHISKFNTSSDDNLETFTLFWLDASVHKAEHNRQSQERLQFAFKQLTAFDDPKQCEQSIRTTSKDDRIVLIISGQLGGQIIPRIHSLEQLLSVYVYCQDVTLNEQWSSQYSKVKAVVTDLNELINRIQLDHEKREQNRIYEALPISIFDPKINHEKLTIDLQGNFVQSQLLINSLLRMKPNQNDKIELTSISKQIYKNSKAELDTIREFEQQYTPEHAIWWYTKDSFLSRLLNKALRTQNINVLFLFQFYVADIQQQLKKLRCKSPIKVYRSQLMSNDQLKRLRNAVGQFISINSFFSAIDNPQRAVSYFEKTDGLEKVLFEIDADPRRADDKPFANIKSYSVLKEEEVLFMLGSIFTIRKVARENDGVWVIQLELCSDDSQQLDAMKNDDSRLLSFGHVLVTMGKVEQAEIYYRDLLDILSENHPGLARCYEGLAAVADEKKEYETSIHLYEKALEINMKAPNKQNLDITSNYNSIGEAYRKKGDYQAAYEYYDNALKAMGEDPKGKWLAKKAVCLNNIGIVHQEQKKYKEALDYYNQALEIRKNHCPSDEIFLGMSHNNIGNAYYFLGCYEDALFQYRAALKIYRRTLPPQHPKLASTYNNIGAIYDDQNKFEEALAYYEDALNIYRSLYFGAHANVTKIEENIERIKHSAKE